MNMFKKIAPFLLLGLMAVRLITSMATINPTTDEPVHLTSGYSYLVMHDFRLNPEHPILFKAIAALPLLVTSVTFPQDDASWAEARQWDIADLFVFHNTLSPDTIILLGRLPMVAITLALGYFIYWWSSALFGRRGGLFSLFLFTFDPNIIAHGQLVTNDVLFCLGALVATYLFLGYTARPTTRNLVIASAGLAFALLTKFSALFLPLSFLIIGAVALHMRLRVNQAKFSPALVKKLGTHALIACLVIAGLIFTVYGFELKKATQDPEFKPGLASIIPIDHGAGKIIYDVLDRVPVPAFSYFKGITLLASHNKYGHDSYLLGDHRTTGWWYYFPVAILVKTPLAIFFFGLLGVILLGKRRKFIFSSLFVVQPTHLTASGTADVASVANGIRLNLITLLGLILPPFIHLALAMQGKINLGLRHVIIVYPFAYLLFGALMRVRIASRKKFALYRTGLAGASMFLIVTSTLIFPHYLSYFNEASGGSTNGWMYLLDSNIDWGQDIKNLREWMRQRNVETVYLQKFGTTPPEAYGISSKPLPKSSELALLKEPLHGYGVISLSDLFNKNRDYSWLRIAQPVDRIGYSMWVYDLDQVKQEAPQN